jgi:hypothetical protein
MINSICILRNGYAAVNVKDIQVVSLSNDLPEIFFVFNGYELTIAYENRDLALADFASLTEKLTEFNYFEKPLDVE